MNDDSQSARSVQKLLPLGIAALAVIVAVGNRDALNTDAIAYLRLAHYWADGNWALAISGYWGPMLPWLSAILLKLGVEPLLAAHLVMAGSAVFFYWAGVRLLDPFPMPGWTRIMAHAAVGFAAVGWSAEQISPDLLVGGWVLTALGLMRREENRTAISGCVWVAFCWTMAYFAKAIAFPLGMATLLIGGLLRAFSQEERWIALKRAALTCCLFLLMASPWIVTLSSRYGSLTFSTTGKIAHAIVGPGDVERYHPFGRTLHQPETGRITSWEDPSRMDYQYWSPFDSREHFEHQLKLIQLNTQTIIQLLWRLDYVGCGLVILVALPFMMYWRRSVCEAIWRLGILIVPVYLLGSAYALTYVQPPDTRYFFVVQPLLIGCVLGTVYGLQSMKVPKIWLIRGVLCSFLFPSILPLLIALETRPAVATIVGREMASRLRSAGITQAIAGSAFNQGHRTGLYTAYFLNVPWRGDRPEHPLELAATTSGTTLIVNRNSNAARVIEGSGRWASLDDRLFENATQASLFPIVAYSLSRP